MIQDKIWRTINMRSAYRIYTSTMILTVLCCILPGCEAVFHNIKVGVSLGTKTGRMPDCMVPEQQLTKNLFVDYFQSSGPCLTPDGSHIYTFRDADQPESTNSYASFNSICLKLPKICQLLRRPRNARSFMDIGHHVADSLKSNMNFLYGLLTGKAVPSPHGDQSTSRFATVYNHQLTAPSHDKIDCRYGACPEYGMNLCETVEDVAFPVVGRSAITNSSVTILQDYPDRVQPIFFRKCKSYKPQIIYGRCIQEFLPMSVYVASAYTDSVSAQDFVMVESGCHVVADITYQEWSAKVHDPYLYHEPRNNDVDWRSDKNDTQSSFDTAKDEFRRTAEEGRISFDTVEAEPRRISDRQLFSRG